MRKVLTTLLSVFDLKPRCDVCNKKFRSVRGLNIHISRMHKTAWEMMRREENE